MHNLEFLFSTYLFFYWNRFIMITFSKATYLSLNGLLCSSSGPKVPAGGSCLCLYSSFTKVKQKKTWDCRYTKCKQRSICQGLLSIFTPLSLTTKGLQLLLMSETKVWHWGQFFHLMPWFAKMPNQSERSAEKVAAKTRPTPNLKLCVLGISFRSWLSMVVFKTLAFLNMNTNDLINWFKTSILKILSNVTLLIILVLYNLKFTHRV